MLERILLYHSTKKPKQHKFYTVAPKYNLSVSKSKSKTIEKPDSAASIR
jgi:hypothetical protein